ncbi:MAG TPA: hypothetical protein VMF65_15870 [Acidimicrobiales bacterium]|nr:hypothetical protein [Acidimicrobiales bacterium]
MTKPPTPSLALKPRRLALLSLVIAGGALLIAACGGSPNDAAVAHLGKTTATDAPSTQNGGSPSNSNSGPSGGSGPAGGQSSFSMAGGSESTMLAYSHCMQTHGVPSFPEPNGQGVVQANGLNPGSPSFQAADKDCRHLLPNGGQPTAAQQAQAMAQALKMSQCMRAHGIKDFPDPQAGPGGGIAIRLHSTPGSDLNPQNPQFQAAQNACQGILGGPKNGKFGVPKNAPVVDK